MHFSFKSIYLKKKKKKKKKVVISWHSTISEIYFYGDT